MTELRKSNMFIFWLKCYVLCLSEGILCFEQEKIRFTHDTKLLGSRNAVCFKTAWKERERQKSVMNVSCFAVVQIMTGLGR